MSRAVHTVPSNEGGNISQDEHQLFLHCQDFTIPPPPPPLQCFGPGYSVPNMQMSSQQCLSALLSNQQPIIQVSSFPPPNYQAATGILHNYNYPSVSQIYDCSSSMQPISNANHMYENQFNYVEPSELETVSRESLQKCDSSWIERWFVEHIQKKYDKILLTSSIHLKIRDAKLLIKQCLECLFELKNTKKDIAENYSTIDSVHWDNICANVESKQEQIITCLSQLTNAQEVLRKVIHKRHKKRLSQKRQRLKRKEIKNENSERRHHLHYQIDVWQRDMQGTIEKTKQEESLKKEADAVLSEVIRKKADGRRQLSLLESLIKVRQLRAKNAANRGQHISTEDGIRFMKVAEHLKDLWEKQLKEYRIEEQGMKVMLNEAVDERDQSRTSRKKQILLKWDHLLFSHDKYIPEFYTAAERDIEAFIDIRKCWDQFVACSDAPVQSSIPIGWILPSNPSSKDWESMLSKE